MILEQLRTTPDSTEFKDIISVIEKHYDYTPVKFSNGVGDTCVINKAGENEGSCKIFAFAKLHNLTEQQTLHCFGHYYRDDVLSNPNKNDHANIRQFIKFGWQHIVFENKALIEK